MWKSDGVGSWTQETTLYYFLRTEPNKMLEFCTVDQKYANRLEYGELLFSLPVTNQHCTYK